MQTKMVDGETPHEYPAKEKSRDHLQNHPYTEKREEEDDDDAEEALSLCDLPIYSNSFNWDDYSREAHSFSTSENDDDLFEFISEDLSSSSSSTFAASDSIIFCGKIIRFRDSSENAHVIKTPKNKNPRKNFLFRWNSHSISQSNYRKQTPQSEPKYVKISKNPSKSEPSKVEFPLGKVSLMASPSSVKSKWYLFMFGMGRIPTEMELRDIRMRQSRRRSRSLVIRPLGGGKPAHERRQRRGRKGLWGILKSLLSKTHRSNAVMEASTGCIPRV